MDALKSIIGLSVVAFIVLLVLLPTLNSILVINHDVDWYNASWENRDTVYLSGSGTDTQIRLNITYKAGMNANFSDLRFTDLNQNEAPHWKQEVHTGSYALVWVKVSDLHGEIYKYYNNPTAVDSSNGNTTFEFFDDFNDGTLDKWNLDPAYGHCTTTTIQGELTLVPQGSLNTCWATANYTGTNYDIITSMYFAGNPAYLRGITEVHSYYNSTTNDSYLTGLSGALNATIYGQAYGDYKANQSNYIPAASIPILPTNTWYVWHIHNYGSNHTVYLNDSSLFSAIDNNRTSGSPAVFTISAQYGVPPYVYYSKVGYYNWFAVTKATAIAPSYYTGHEETYSGLTEVVILRLIETLYAVIPLLVIAMLLIIIVGHI